MGQLNTPVTHLKLGTRRSLLAWAQSSWVARELERLHAARGLKVELVGIDTRGDKILDIPLSKVEGKEFFVAELDDALRSGRVDFSVHSLKDLSLERPAEFELVCMPRREDQRDVIVFSPKVLERLGAGEPLTVGSSSPRRLENLPPFLSRALPTLNGRAPQVKFAEIRGNVNTRLGRLHEAPGAERYLDGVVLALAGLSRLWRDDKGRAELEKLFKGCRWMVMPLRQNPTAPGQGSLAVECRAPKTPRDAEVKELLLALHDEPTRAQVQRERAVLAKWGGGCHQRFGASCVPVPELGELLYIRGRLPDGSFIDEAKGPERGAAPVGQAWNGSEWRGEGLEWIFEGKEKALEGKGCVFIAHARAVPPSWVPLLSGMRIWTSGAASWFKLAKMGLWVEGCAENLGFDHLVPTLRKPVLGLAPLSAWTALTHEAGAAGWGEVAAVATYRVSGEKREEAAAALRKAGSAYWGSASQFERYGAALAPEKLKAMKHACGPGKTAAALRAKGLEPQVFLSSEDWKKWTAN